jgi:hypothetical protein
MELSETQLLDRIKGALIGLACGDGSGNNTRV